MCFWIMCLILKYHIVLCSYYEVFNRNAVYAIRFGYVCASKTMALRKLLEAETTDAGFTNEEKGKGVEHKVNVASLYSLR